jgi:transposase
MVRLTITQRQEIAQQAQAGVSIASLSRRYKCDRRAVKRWVVEGCKAAPDWHDAPGRGRKPKLAAKLRARARQYAKSGCTSRIIKARLQKRYHVGVSQTTVLKTLHTGNPPGAWRPVLHGRKLSPKNKEQRLDYCLDPPKAIRRSLRKLVFLDAKYVYGHFSGQPYAHYAWQFGEPEECARAAGNPCTLFFYAAIAHGHKSKLYFVAPTPDPKSKARKGKVPFKGEHYVHMMEQLKRELDCWFPNGDYVIIRDRARQHTSRASTAAVERLGMTVDTRFPAQSWDLNVIETAWGNLVGKLYLTRASSVRGWRQAVREAWEEVAQSTINKLVKSLPRRMQEVVEREGAWPSKYRGKCD